MGTTWHALVRVEKNGEAAEYNDLVHTRRHVPTAKAIEDEVISAILKHSPHLKGGRVTRRDIRRIRQPSRGAPSACQHSGAPHPPTTRMRAEGPPT